MKCCRSLLFYILALGVAAKAGAIACPGSGSKLKVSINNPTTNTSVAASIHAEVITGQQTCLGKSTSFTQGVTLTSTGTNDFVLPVSGGLNSGMWKVSITIGSQTQYQQVPVLYTSNPSDYATANFTYFPAVVMVDEAGDAGNSTDVCIFPGLTCSFRHAVNTATALISNNLVDAVLIQFNLSPGTMTQAADIVVGTTSAPGPIMIDGTDSNGNPWIVGDALAAAQGNQDSFSTLVDLNNATKIRIDGPDVTIKGLQILNSGGSPSTTDPLIEVNGPDARIEAVQLDGGHPGSCDDCEDHDADLINVQASGPADIVNVEGRGALSNGALINSTGEELTEVRDSWFHHNYASNIKADGTLLTRNMIELSGRRLSDDVVVNTSAVGIAPESSSQIETDGNVVRNHPSFAIDVIASNNGLDLANDYVCGSGATGIMINGAGTPSATGTGITTAYNSSGGIDFDNSIIAGTMDFDDNSAFTANSSCGFANNSSVTVSANNNQWRGVSCALPDRCSGGGTVSCGTVQDYKNVGITINSSQPTFPSNVILKGQTIRVEGTGFNAIDGNPRTSDPGVSCTLGNGVSSSNCCRQKTKANQCVAGGAGSPPAAPSGGSNCVALFNGASQWKLLPVTSVTPTTIVSEITDGVFVCIGSSNEKVRVAKQNGIGTELSDEEAYCLNTAPL